jgi:hypothetical protein
MNLYDLLQNNAGVNITINAGQLCEAIDYCVTKTKEAFEAKQIPEEYVTRQRTAELLGVDLSTLWRWNRDGYLCTVKVGSKVLYRLSDINKILKAEV